ncbi:hypothetical protein SRHO_G00276540 [Serrasalmus rhombeus]
MCMYALMVHYGTESKRPAAVEWKSPENQRELSLPALRLSVSRVELEVQVFPPGAPLCYHGNEGRQLPGDGLVGVDGRREGRSVQDYFVRAANQRKGMLASTHLVLQTPEGTKYQAAQKWRLPAVTLRWVLESARTGKRADEARYLVELPPSPDVAGLTSVPAGQGTEKMPERGRLVRCAVQMLLD